MFCFQCQETAKNQGCTVKGVCGKPEETADLQDLLLYHHFGRRYGRRRGRRCRGPAGPQEQSK